MRPWCILQKRIRNWNCGCYLYGWEYRRSA